jgi:hypothetical protein
MMMPFLCIPSLSPLQWLHFFASQDFFSDASFESAMVVAATIPKATNVMITTVKDRVHHIDIRKANIYVIC